MSALYEHSIEEQKSEYIIEDNHTAFTQYTQEDMLVSSSVIVDEQLPPIKNKQKKKRNVLKKSKINSSMNPD